MSRFLEELIGEKILEEIKRDNPFEYLSNLKQQYEELIETNIYNPELAHKVSIAWNNYLENRNIGR